MTDPRLERELRRRGAARPPAQPAGGRTAAPPADRLERELARRRGAEGGLLNSLAEMPEQLLGGALAGLRQMGRTAIEAGEAVADLVGIEDPYGVERFAEQVTGETAPPGAASAALRQIPELVPQVDEAETTAGGITRAVSQFLTGFLGANKMLKGLGTGARLAGGARRLGAGERTARLAGRAGQAELAAQLADQVVFDPYEARLSNLVEEFPSLANPVTEWLAADPRDPQALARLKVGLEGAGLGALVGGFADALGRIRANRRARAAEEAAGETPIYRGGVRRGEPEAPAPAAEAAAPQPPPAPSFGSGVTGGVVTPETAAEVAGAVRRTPPAIEPGQVSRGLELEDLGRQREIEARAAAGDDPELDRALNIVRGKSAAPRQPRSLTAFLRDRGLKEDRGELASIGITPRAAPGLVNNRGGRSLDEAAEAAWEAGYFTGERPDIPTFLAALADDFNGSRRLIHPDDAELARQHDFIADLAETLAREEIPLDLSNAEVRARLQRLEPPGQTRGLEDLAAEEAGLGRSMADFPESGLPPQPERAGNLRLDKIRGASDAKQALRETATRFAPEIEEAQRGRITLDQTRKLASEMGMSVEQLLKRQKGEAFNAEQVIGARRLLAASARQVANLAKTVPGGGDDALAAFQEAYLRHVAIQEQVAGLTAEAGRALGAFRAAVQGDAQAVKAVIDRMGGRASMEDLAEAIDSLDGDPGALSAFTRKSFKPRWRDKAFELWINALLSSPRTHAVNITSNALTQLWTLPETALAAGLGSLRRGSDKVYLGEVPARYLGTVEGFRDGLRAFAKSLRTGEPVFDPVTKIEQERFRAIGGPAGGVIRTPTRFLQAEDELFKAIAYRAELRQLALRSGRQAGLKGDALARRVQTILDDPPAELRARAVDAARYLTFQQRLGRIGQATEQLRERIPGGKVVLPFLRTPANIMKFFAERSPLAPAMSEVRRDLKAGGVARDMALARLGLGSTVGATVASLAAEGHVTGGGPSEPATRALLRATGWQPYSVKIGDDYYSYQRLEPLGMLLGVAADFAEISGHLPRTEAEKLGALIVGSISKNLLDKTWLRGPAELVEALQDPDRYGQRWLQSLAGSLVPTGVAHVAQQMDPVLRTRAPELGGDALLTEARSILNAWKARLPGFSQDLPPVRNVWGEPVVLTGGLGPDMVSPIFTSRDTRDATAEELLRLGVVPGRPSRTFMGVRLGPQQYDLLATKVGRITKAYLDAVIGSPAYQALRNDALRERMVRRVLREAREEGREVFATEAGPELAGAIGAARRQDLRAPLAPQPYPFLQR